MLAPVADVAPLVPPLAPVGSGLLPVEVLELAAAFESELGDVDVEPLVDSKPVSAGLEEDPVIEGLPDCAVLLVVVVADPFVVVRLPSWLLAKDGTGVRVTGAPTVLPTPVVFGATVLPTSFAPTPGLIVDSKRVVIEADPLLRAAGAAVEAAPPDEEPPRA